MKLTITLKFHDDGDGATLVPTIDGVAHEIVREPLKALPKPRPWWRSKNPNLLDGAVIVGTVASVVWWLS